MSNPTELPDLDRLQRIADEIDEAGPFTASGELRETIHNLRRAQPEGEAPQAAAPDAMTAFRKWHQEVGDQDCEYTWLQAWTAAQCAKPDSTPGTPEAPADKRRPGWERGIATVTLTGHQLREALDFLNPDGDDDVDQRDNDLTFGIVQHKDDAGATKTGLCCWNDDSDGVLPLDEYPRAAQLDGGQGEGAGHADQA